MFGRPASGLRQGHAGKAARERPVCGPRRGSHHGRPPRRVPHLAAGDGRGTPDEEVTRVDETIDRAADKLQELAEKAAAQDGLKAKLAEPLAEDAAFLRKLKPSLIAARARGEAPTDQKPGAGTVVPPPAPKSPKAKREGGGGPNPWLVAGVALAAGIA